MVKCDFSGWATRNDLKCGDGRVIKKDAFKDNDGKIVSLIWNHDHTNPDAVLGHALLENRDEGVYAYCTFNDTQSGENAKKLVQHGDVSSLSIYANKLKQNGNDVIHGEIRELSLVLAGANPGAYIDFVMAHSDDEDETIDELYAGYNENIVLYHSDDESMKETEKKTDEQTTEKEDGEETVADVLNTLTEKQKTVVYAMIGQALENGEADDEKHSEGGDETMKKNVFDREDNKDTNVLTHSDMNEILEL